jgi:hypothetical protein
MKSTPALVMAVILVLFCIPATAQVATGTYPFGSFTGGPDVINLGTLNDSWKIPVVNMAGGGMIFV